MDRYREILEYKTDEGVRYKQNPIYPDIPEHEDDIYIITTGGDRYDMLAYQFYKDASLWWIIATANNYIRYNLSPKPGIQLRIPHDKDKVLADFNKLNEIR